MKTRPLVDGLTIVMKYYPNAELWMCDHKEFCVGTGIFHREGDENTFGHFEEIDFDKFTKEEISKLEELGFMIDRDEPSLSIFQ